MKNLFIKAMLGFVVVLFTIAIAITGIPGEVDSQDSSNILDFTTRTVAICEDRGDSIYCHDELIVNCGDEEYVVPKTTESVKCGEIEFKTPSITAAAVFDQDWEDPRTFIAE